VPRRGDHYADQNHRDFHEIEKQKIPVERRQVGSEKSRDCEKSSGKNGSEKSRDNHR
jgi:hypothetical protein